MVNINPIKPTISLLTILDKEQRDEFGFIVMTAEARLERLRYLARIKHSQGGSAIGKNMGGICKDLCKYLPHKKTGRTISLEKTGEYWCSQCGCVMKCQRCRCCGRIGRAKPQRRAKRLDNPNTKFVE